VLIYHRQLKRLVESVSICDDVMSEKDAQWFRRGTVLKVFPAFRLEMKALGNPKGKVVLELWGEMLFWGLGFLRVK
jgi:hypothetical protein